MGGGGREKSRNYRGGGKVDRRAGIIGGGGGREKSRNCRGRGR